MPIYRYKQGIMSNLGDFLSKKSPIFFENEDIF